MLEDSSLQYGRAFFERVLGHRYRRAKALPATAREISSQRQFVWVDPANWGCFPNLAGRRIAIVGNTKVIGQGREIDAYEDVIRLNRMGYWRRQPDDDGVRLTIWAGVPWANIIPDERDKERAAPYLPSCFPEIASQLTHIWSATPFHLSVRFVDFLDRHGLRDRLFVSGGSLYLFDHLVGKIPPEMFRELYSIRHATLPEGVVNQQFNFDQLLTGVKIAFLCALAKAREIGLFGFDFFDGSERRPWGAHDLAFDKAFLDSVVTLAATWGTRIQVFSSGRR